MRDKIFGMYQEFVSNFDLVNVFDLLIQNKIINPKQRYNLTNKVAIEDRWQALLDILISCPKEKAFIILKEALEKHYPRIVERIGEPDTDGKLQIKRSVN